MKIGYICIKRKIRVKDDLIDFDEKVKINEETNEEIYDRDLEIENTNRLYDIYRKKHNLCSSEDIANIRKKYDLSQTDYALILGFGKITIHRYENGCLQTVAQDIIIKNSNNIYEMERLLEQNKNKVSNEVYRKLKRKIQELKFNEEKIETENLEKKLLEIENSMNLILEYTLIEKEESFISKILSNFKIKICNSNNINKKIIV